MHSISLDKYLTNTCIYVYQRIGLSITPESFLCPFLVSSLLALGKPCFSGGVNQFLNLAQGLNQSRGSGWLWVRLRIFWCRTEALSSIVPRGGRMDVGWGRPLLSPSSATPAVGAQAAQPLWVGSSSCKRGRWMLPNQVPGRKFPKHSLPFLCSVKGRLKAVLQCAVDFAVGFPLYELILPFIS